MKKLAAFITAILMLSFIIIPTNTVQAMSMNEIIKSVEQTNIQINREIEKAVYAAQIITENYNDDLVAIVNNKDNVKKNQIRIKILRDVYNARIDKLVNDLLKVTNKMATETINSAAKEGVTVYCQWVKVTLGGRTVLVDPIRIGNY